MEGGEMYYCQKDNILFAGEFRNSNKGNELTAELLKVRELIILKSSGFHLDTVFSPVFNSTGSLCACIVCIELLDVDSREKLQVFAKKRGIELLYVSPEEAIGINGKLGSFAVNCLPLPGTLIGCAIFENEFVNDALRRHGVKHITTPLSQFRLSGGSVHCLTNEL